ncbi:hypothetical protein XH89_11380 [Bradyrhizobium sp. CCBAU 53340]|uniref:hypothetical protein n=1 Tax=Bradyrhizobium sp. CCBAU 53340 TaxID=1325112 RepID=UPI00188A3807|nr:hypothetical protein [Bradyrhizobium sp. CCBAU 53340]QOZ44020.1 hypothetical protein XH89_11380 [Bradyrhizobium sp. CCBAU 53340]
MSILQIARGALIAPMYLGSVVGLVPVLTMVPIYQLLIRWPGRREVLNSIEASDTKQSPARAGLCRF